MTLLLIFLRLLQLLEFLTSPLGIAIDLWLGCYWLMLHFTTGNIGLASGVATLCAISYSVLEQPEL